MLWKPIYTYKRYYMQMCGCFLIFVLFWNMFSGRWMQMQWVEDTNTTCKISSCWSVTTISKFHWSMSQLHTCTRYGMQIHYHLPELRLHAVICSDMFCKHAHPVPLLFPQWWYILYSSLCQHHWSSGTCTLISY